MQVAVTATLRSYWPQISAVIHVAVPLWWGTICALAVRRRLLTGGWAWTPLVALFPLLAPRVDALPGLAIAVPFTCWLSAALSVRSRYKSWHAASLFATGVASAALQLWQESGWT